MSSTAPIHDYIIRTLGDGVDELTYQALLAYIDACPYDQMVSLKALIQGINCMADGRYYLQEFKDFKDEKP